MERILLAADGSEHAARAAEMAGTLSACWDVPVDIVHVVRQTPVHSPRIVGTDDHIKRAMLATKELAEAAGLQALSWAADIVRANGGEVGRDDLLYGRPAHMIAEFAKEVGSDVVVMGRRGMGDLKGLLMGSVSQRVGQLSDVTLITTK